MEKEKTYPCYECDGRLHKKEGWIVEGKQLWVCDKCDGVFTVSFPYRYTISKEMLEEKE